MLNRKVCVTIPIYKEMLSFSEERSLLRAFKVFSAFKIVLFCPKGLKLSNYFSLLVSCQFAVEYFEKFYFNDIDGYNQLMLSPRFYKRFLKFNYILIYQLDAFVFKNDLRYWTSCGFDYIGAPWYNSDIDRIYASILSSHTKVGRFLKWIFKKKGKKIYVGNGGFSLRNTRKFFIISLLLGGIIKNWESNEDYFWGVFVSTFIPFFKTPSIDIAAKFSLEEGGERIVQGTDDLPFGCHGWQKYNPTFWTKIIKESVND